MKVIEKKAVKNVIKRLNFYIDLLNDRIENNDIESVYYFKGMCDGIVISLINMDYYKTEKHTERVNWNGYINLKLKGSSD